MIEHKAKSIGILLSSPQAKVTSPPAALLPSISFSSHIVHRASHKTAPGDLWETNLITSPNN